MWLGVSFLGSTGASQYGGDCGRDPQSLDSTNSMNLNHKKKAQTCINRDCFNDLNSFSSFQDCVNPVDDTTDREDLFETFDD